MAEIFSVTEQIHVDRGKLMMLVRPRKLRASTWVQLCGKGNANGRRRRLTDSSPREKWRGRARLGFFMTFLMCKGSSRQVSVLKLERMEKIKPNSTIIC